MATENTRDIILETLLLITRDGQYSHLVLGEVLSRYQYLDKKDRAFITRVTEGTIERQIELDYIIEQFSKVPVRKMKPVIRTILRSAVYQMKYMDSVPDRAAINEAVNLAGKRGFKNLKGFVNGVLRSVSRGLGDIRYSEDGVKSLSVRCSLPEWLVRMWIDTYGYEQTEEMGRSFLSERALTVRTNLSRTTPETLRKRLEAEGVAVREAEGLPYAFYLEGIDYLGALESFEEGDFYVQDISSMQVAEWADPKAGDTVLDVCAAPGGKAIHVAEKLYLADPKQGFVLARDLSDHKVEIIEENIERCSLSNVTAQVWDATVFDPTWEEKADIVIADLPCSGLGVLKKKPDIKYRATKEDTHALAKLQREILDVVCRYVKPGGKLIYSTCTINRTENEETTAFFVKTHPQFALVREQQMLPTEAGDGFYLAELIRETD